MAGVEIKSFDSPTETRPFEGHGQIEIVELAGQMVGKATFEPGWRWSNDVKPIAGTDSCQANHFGYVLSGRMKVYMNDGTEAEYGEGDLYAIQPGHDAEVLGDVACVALDWGQFRDYAKRS